jgi:hypothetical protein
MMMLSLAVAWVNGLAEASAAAPELTPGAIFVLLLFIGALLLGWVIRQLRPTFVLATELLRVAVMTAVTATLVIGGLVLLLAATVAH